MICAIRQGYHSLMWSVNSQMEFVKWILKMSFNSRTRHDSTFWNFRHRNLRDMHKRSNISTGQPQLSHNRNWRFKLQETHWKYTLLHKVWSVIRQQFAWHLKFIDLFFDFLFYKQLMQFHKNYNTINNKSHLLSCCWSWE